MNFDKESKSRKLVFFFWGGGGGGGGGVDPRSMNMRAAIFCIYDTLSPSLLQNCKVS